jgi:hypothetical protein
MKTSYYSDFSATSSSTNALASIVLATALFAAPLSGQVAAQDINPVQTDEVYTTAFDLHGSSILQELSSRPPSADLSMHRKIIKTKVIVRNIEQRKPAGFDTGYLVERV